MQWYEICGYIMGVIGTFLSGSWLLNIYHAKPQKNSIEIDNMKKAMDELQVVIRQMSESSKTYRETTDTTIKELRNEVKDLSVRVDIKHEAIYASMRCDKIDDINECIVMKTFKTKCQECGINKD